MASRQLHIEIDIIGRPHFLRLVEFLAEVEQLADERVDLELRELIEDARADLRNLES